jgi:hypothetical protein
MFDFSEINWDMLRQQKIALLELRNDLDKVLSLDQSWLKDPERLREQADALSGVIHLIDYVQDSAIESGEFSEDEVFAFTRDEDGYICERCGGSGVIMDGDRKVPCPAECKVGGK